MEGEPSSSTHEWDFERLQNELQRQSENMVMKKEHGFFLHGDLINASVSIAIEMVC